MSRPTWRVRLSAAASFTDHLLLHADSLISACLDIRPISNTLSDVAAWLGRTWREHLNHAHVRCYGPGRGVIAVVINRPTKESEETRD